MIFPDILIKIRFSSDFEVVIRKSDIQTLKVSPYSMKHLHEKQLRKKIEKQSRFSAEKSK